ncbi:hypothetical protein ABIB68_008358 [Bradyrhizobium sp. F1.2.2]
MSSRWQSRTSCRPRPGSSASPGNRTCGDDPQFHVISTRGVLRVERTGLNRLAGRPLRYLSVGGVQADPVHADETAELDSTISTAHYRPHSARRRPGVPLVAAFVSREPRPSCKWPGRAQSNGMRPRRSQRMIQPAIYLLSGVWMACVRQAQTRQRQGSNRCAAAGEYGGQLKENMEDNINRARIAFVTAGIAATARRRSDTHKRPSRGRSPCCRHEQGSRHRDGEHRDRVTRHLTSPNRMSRSLRSIRASDLDVATSPWMDRQSESVQLHDCRNQVQAEAQARRVPHLVRPIEAPQDSVALLFA